jgi:hypothetical protein
VDHEEHRKRRTERLPWTRDEMRLWLADIGTEMAVWESLVGNDAAKGNDLSEFKVVLEGFSSRLARFSFSLDQMGMEEAPGWPTKKE